jgi:hypothetical protein
MALFGSVPGWKITEWPNGVWTLDEDHDQPIFTSAMIDFSEEHRRKIFRGVTIGNPYNSPKEESMRDKLFEYAVIYHPKVTKADTDEARRVRSRLLVEPTPILARDEAEVRAKAFRQLDEEYDEKLDQIEVLVVPFA